MCEYCRGSCGGIGVGTVDRRTSDDKCVGTVGVVAGSVTNYVSSVQGSSQSLRLRLIRNTCGSSHAVAVVTLLV